MLERTREIKCLKQKLEMKWNERKFACWDRSLLGKENVFT